MEKRNLGIIKKGKGDAMNAKNAARSYRALAAHEKPGKVGVPFKPGEDPRRHKLGRVSLDRAAFAVKLNNFLCNGEGDPEDLAKILWRYVRKGEPWAVKEILDRILGRCVQPIEVEEKPKRITYVVKYADGGPTVPYAENGRILKPGEVPAASANDEERPLILPRELKDHDGR